MSAQTNEMLREADVLIAEIAEFQRDMNHNLSKYLFETNCFTVIYKLILIMNSIVNHLYFRS